MFARTLEATTTIAWGPPSAIVYGTALSSTQLNATASFAGAAVEGAFVYNPASGTVLAVGRHTVWTTFTPAAPANFTPETKSVTIEVTKATPVITWANPASIVYGTALSGTQLNATANVSGTFVYTPGAGTVLNAGVGQTLSTAFAPADATNYTTAFRTVPAPGV